ncbi:ATP-binding protein [Candidatus Binatia bacterium]|nr:ATP-binding protein [Candidatus Binatia bacterium]
MTDVSAALAVAAAVFAVVTVWREPAGRRIERSFVLGLTLVAWWTVATAIVVRVPFWTAAERMFLGLHCAASAPWWYLAARLSAGGAAGVVGPWRTAILLQAAVSLLAAVAAGAAGIDWVTGIGSEPTVVLSRLGTAAVGVGAVPAVVGLVLVGRMLAGGSVGLPVLAVGVTAAMAGVLWASVGMLWRGYFTIGWLISPAVVVSLAAVLWAVGLVWPAAPRRPAPSRRFVFETIAVAVVLVYLLAAQSIVALVARIAAGVAPVLPVIVAALAVAAFLLAAGSQRVRHYFRGAIGRYLFRSKHDYGEVWIHLTEMIARAKGPGDLLQRAALFCRDLLYVSEASVWLVGPSGAVARATTTRPESGPPAEIEPRPVDDATADDHAVAFAWAAGCALASPLRLNGQVLGFLAVGVPGETRRFDDEDRRVLQYIAAQVASAVALYRSGEEVAEAREVASFHRLSAFIIHDLKNLVAQQSFVLQNASTYRHDPAFMADALEAFDDSTNRMRALIERLRARGEAGAAVPAVVAPWDLLDLLGELLTMPRVGRRPGCRISLLRPEQGGPCLVTADRNSLGQVFENLLINAVESLPAEGGDLIVRIARDGPQWRIAVSDTGCGIPEAFRREHMFRPFRTTKPGGLGIGLYQCRSLVDAAGGSITVRSREGYGTEVTVCLPAAPGPATESNPHQKDQDAETPSADRR